MTGYLNTLHHTRRDVRLFLVATVFMGFGFFGIHLLLLNLYLLRLGYDTRFLGLVNGVAPLGLAAIGPFASAFHRRWGYRRTLAIGLGLDALGLGLLPFAEFLPAGWQSAWLIGAPLFAWMGGALFVATGSPFLMSVTRPEERDHVFSMQSALIPLSGFAGNLVGGLLPGLFARLLGVSLDQPDAYRYPLWIAAIIILPAVPAMLAISEVDQVALPEKTAADGRPPYGPILLVALVMLLRTSSEWVVRIFFNAYLDTSLRTPTALIGALFAAGQLLGVAALVSPPVVNRWGRRRTIGWAMVGMALSILPLALVPHWAAAGLSFMGVIGLIALATPPLFVLSQEIVPLAWRSTMAGAMTMAVGLSIGSMSLGGGYLATALGYRQLFLVGAALALAGAVLFALYFRRPRGQFAITAAPLAGPGDE